MLPKIEAPRYEVELPVSKQKLSFRPMLVKEQKVLLLAMEADEPQFITNNITQILQNCTLNDIDIDNLPLVDIEYYFLNLRARSVGEEIESSYKCENIVEDGKKCGNLMDVKYKVLDVKINIPEKQDVILISDTVGVKMKYPTYAIIEKLKKMDSYVDVGFEFAINCIDYVFEGDSFYYIHETPREEVIQFLESLTKDQFGKIEDFIMDLPTIEKTVNMTCSKCGFEHNITVKALEDFFV